MTEQLPGCDHFDHDGAWRIESAVVARCHMEGLAVTISTWLGEQCAFHTAFPGTSADNHDWVNRKACVVHNAMNTFDRSNGLRPFGSANIIVSRCETLDRCWARDTQPETRCGAR